MSMHAGSPGTPLVWPAVLDINMRADTAYLLAHTLTPASNLPVRTLRLAAAAEPKEAMDQRGRFIDLLNGLSTRSRAGVVQWSDGKGGGPQRTLYLLPPSASVAERLRVTWDQKECLLAVFAAT